MSYVTLCQMTQELCHFMSDDTRVVTLCQMTHELCHFMSDDTGVMSLYVR